MRFCEKPLHSVLCSGFFFSELQPLLQKTAQRCKGIRGKAGHQQSLPVQLCWSICVRCTKGLLHIAVQQPFSLPFHAQHIHVAKALHGVDILDDGAACGDYRNFTGIFAKNH